MVNPLNGAKRDCYGRTVRRGGRGVRDGRVGGTALAETANRPALSPLFSRRCFDLYVLLSSEGGGKITALHDRCGSPIPQS